MHKSAPVRFGSIRARPPHAEAGRRIGLLGGSFNPPHAAHRQISQIALKRLKLDRVWWIVTPGNPLKSTGELAPQNERIAVARQVAQDARIVVTGFEAELGSAFTAGTLAFVTRAIRAPVSSGSWAPTACRSSIAGASGGTSSIRCPSPSSTGQAGICRHCPRKPPAPSPAPACQLGALLALPMPHHQPGPS